MVRGNGPWSPRGRVGLRKERGLFIPFNRRQVRASVDGHRVGGPVYGWRGDIIFLDSHLPVDISGSVVATQILLSQGKCFSSLPLSKPSYPSGFTLFINSISTLPVTKAPNHIIPDFSLLQHAILGSLLSVPDFLSLWH